MSKSTLFKLCRDGGLPGLNQYLAGDKVSWPKTQHSDLMARDETRAINPSVPILTLFRATALPDTFCQ